MGTFGAGPFDSDGAQDLLDQLSQLPADRRRGRLQEIFQAASAGLAPGRGGCFPDEIVAAAAVVAASLPGGKDLRRDLSRHSRVPDAVALPEASFELAAPALRALLAAAGPDGPWHEGWADPDTAAAGRATSDEIAAVLSAT